MLPPPEKLRYWYEVPEGKPLAGYYLRHPFSLARRLAQGLLARERAARAIDLDQRL